METKPETSVDVSSYLDGNQITQDIIDDMKDDHSHLQQPNFDETKENKKEVPIVETEAYEQRKSDTAPNILDISTKLDHVDNENPNNGNQNIDDYLKLVKNLPHVPETCDTFETGDASKTKNFIESEKTFHCDVRSFSPKGDDINIINASETSKMNVIAASKVFQEDNEKFISSEDLRSDFKEAKNIGPMLAPFDSSKDENGTSSNLFAWEIEENDENVSQKVTKNFQDVVKEKVASPKLGQMISAEEIFFKYGLDAWFKPDRLHPKVESLIYWRNVKQSGIVFGAGLTILLAILFFSVISVFAYVSLLVLIGTFIFRIYKDVLATVQKTTDGHPFKEYLEQDWKISQEKANNVVNVAVAHINATVLELRRLFLIENFVDSLKFGFILWTCTYIGSWFNGMTILILTFVALFTLPKVYENNKQSIDSYIDLVRNKFLEITEKVKAAIPIGKKQESSKDK